MIATNLVEESCDSRGFLAFTGAPNFSFSKGYALFQHLFRSLCLILNMFYISSEKASKKQARSKDLDFVGRQPALLAIIILTDTNTVIKIRKHPA